LLNLIAWILVSVAGVYAVIGVAFAAFFVWRGVQRIDPAAVEGTVGFRLLVFPGAVAFWPVLMRRVQERSMPPEERNAHRDAAYAEEDDSAATHPVVPGATE
jgi:hypothetical protein